jgi:hypothetical protein
MTLTQSIARIAVGAAFLLMIPLMAMQFTQEVNWTLADFVFAGVVLFGAGLTYVLIARKRNNPAYRLGVGVAVLAGFLLVWANAAVGLVGSEKNNANLLYAGVLAVALIEAFVARFRPLGMSHAMFAAALTYALVTAVALFVWTPAGAGAEPRVSLVNVLGVNAVFAAVWVVAGVLFRRAGAAGSHAGSQMA